MLFRKILGDYDRFWMGYWDGRFNIDAQSMSSGWFFLRGNRCWVTEKCMSFETIWDKSGIINNTTASPCLNCYSNRTRGWTGQTWSFNYLFKHRNRRWSIQDWSFLTVQGERSLVRVAQKKMSSSVDLFEGSPPFESIWTNRWVENEMVYDLDPQATGSWFWLISLLGLPHSTTPLGLPHWPHSPVTIYWMVLQVWDNHWGLRIMIQNNTHIYIYITTHIYIYITYHKIWSNPTALHIFWNCLYIYIYLTHLHITSTLYPWHAQLGSLHNLGQRQPGGWNLPNRAEGKSVIKNHP